MKRNEVLNTDWHPADIKAALEKRGLTLRQLSVEAGYAEDSLKSVLRTPCRPYQQIIATALDVPPDVIWPSRYQGSRCWTREVA